jgi:hypothetical protein
MFPRPPPHRSRAPLPPPRTHRRRDLREHPPGLRHWLAAVHRPRSKPRPRALGRAPGPHRDLPGPPARGRSLGPDPELAGGGDPVLSPAGRIGVADRSAGGARSARGCPPRGRRPLPPPRYDHRQAPRRCPPVAQRPPATPLAIRDRAILLLTFASGRRRAESTLRTSTSAGPTSSLLRSEKQNRSGRGRPVCGGAAVGERAVRGGGR